MTFHPSSDIAQVLAVALEPGPRTRPRLIRRPADPPAHPTPCQVVHYVTYRVGVTY